MEDESLAPSTKPLRPFDLLPDELLLHILELAVPIRNLNVDLPLAQEKRRKTLLAPASARRALRSVSRRWRDAVGPETCLLFESSVGLSDGRWTPEHGSEMPLRTEIKSLWADLQGVNRCDQLVALLRSLPRLEQLELGQAISTDRDETLWPTLEVVLPRLKRLACGRMPYELLEPILVNTSPKLQELDIKLIVGLPSAFPSFQASLRRLHFGLHSSHLPGSSPPYDLLTGLIQGSNTTLQHLHLAATPISARSAQLSAIVEPVAEQLLSFSMEMIALGALQEECPVHSLLSRMTSLHFLRVKGCLLPSFPSTFAFLPRQPFLRTLSLDWDHKRARDGRDWSWDALALALSDGNETRREELVVEVEISGVLRSYDIAQRSSRAAFEESGVEKVQVWLKYWEDPFRVY